MARLNATDQYLLLIDLYKYYTQLSLEIIKYVSIFNVALISAFGLSSGATREGVFGVVISILALIVCVAAALSFRRCIAHCYLFRDLAIRIEKKMGLKTFSRVRQLNQNRKGMIFKSQTYALILLALIAILWILVLLSSMGIHLISTEATVQS